MISEPARETVQVVAIEAQALFAGAFAPQMGRSGRKLSVFREIGRVYGGSVGR